MWPPGPPSLQEGETATLAPRKGAERARTLQQSARGPQTSAGISTESPGQTPQAENTLISAQSQNSTEVTYSQFINTQSFLNGKKFLKEK